MVLQETVLDVGRSHCHQLFGEDVGDLPGLHGYFRLILRVQKEVDLEFEGRQLLGNHYPIELRVVLVELPEISVRVYFLLLLADEVVATGFVAVLMRVALVVISLS